MFHVGFKSESSIQPESSVFLTFMGQILFSYWKQDLFPFYYIQFTTKLWEEEVQWIITDIEMWTEAASSFGNRPFWDLFEM